MAGIASSGWNLDAAIGGMAKVHSKENKGSGAGSESADGRGLRPDSALTLAEAAVAGGVSVQTLEKALAEGRLLHEIKTGGGVARGTVFVRWVDVQGLLGLQASSFLQVSELLPVGLDAVEHPISVQTEDTHHEVLGHDAPWERLYGDLAQRLDQSERERRAQSAALLVAQRHLLELAPAAAAPGSRLPPRVAVALLVMVLTGFGLREMWRADELSQASLRLGSALNLSRVTVEEVAVRASLDRADLEARLVEADQLRGKEREDHRADLEIARNQWVSAGETALQNVRSDAARAERILRQELEIARQDAGRDRAAQQEAQALQEAAWTEVFKRAEEQQDDLLQALGNAQAQSAAAQDALTQSLEDLAALGDQRDLAQLLTEEIQTQAEVLAARVERSEVALLRTWKGVGSPPLPVASPGPVATRSESLRQLSMRLKTGLLGSFVLRCFLAYDRAGGRQKRAVGD